MKIDIRKHLIFLNDNNGSLKEKTFRSGFWVTAGSIMVRSIELVRSIILARLLTPEIFGLMAIVLMINQGLETFTQTGFGSAIIQRKKTDINATDTAWVITILRSFFLAGLLLFSAPFVAKFYHRPELELFLRVMCIGFIIQGFRNINVILYQKELNFKYIAISEQIVSIINFIVVVSVAYFYRSVWALIIGQLTMYLCSTIVSYFIQPIRPKFKFNKEIAKELFSYGKFLTGGAIVVFITLEIDNAFIGKMFGMKALGYYALAYSLANLPATHITQMISNVMFPTYSKLQDDQQKLNRVYLKALRLVTTFTVPAAVGIALLAPEIIGVVYGDKWLPAVPALRILCIFGLIRSIGATTGPLFNAINKPHIPFYLNSVKLIIIGVIIYPLTLNYNTTGTALAIVIPAVLMQFIVWKVLKKVCHLKIIEIIKAIFFSVASSAIMAGSIKGFSIYQKIQDQAILLISQIAIGIVVYFSIQFFMQKTTIKLLLLGNKQNVN